jgi:hypothetical protein
MKSPIEVRIIQQFDANGQIWRAFDHLIARRYGTVLMIPVGITVGNLHSVVDRCPIPLEEATAIMQGGPLRNTGERQVDCPALRLLTAFAPAAEWELDHVVLGTVGQPSIRRLLHESGMRYAEPILDDPHPHLHLGAGGAGGGLCGAGARPRRP